MAFWPMKDEVDLRPLMENMVNKKEFLESKKSGGTIASSGFEASNIAIEKINYENIFLSIYYYQLIENLSNFFF